jgi:hypothetical protein
MPHNPPSRNPLGPVPRRSWLCLVLAISFLFNPFWAISASSFGTIVSHLPSFRATVASSELLKFAPQQKIGEHASPECALPCWFGLSALTPDTPAQLKLTETQNSAAASLAPSGNVWFRPPPAL